MYLFQALAAIVSARKFGINLLQDFFHILFGKWNQIAKLVSDSKSKMKMKKKFGFDYLSFNTEFYFTYFFDFSVYVAIAIAKLKIQQSFSLSLIQPTYWNSKNNVNSLIILGRHIPPIYLHWDFRNFWHSPVWNIQFDFFPGLNWEKIPVWNIKLAKSKIPVRVVKNVISKWTKMEFPRFPFLWFTAVGVVNSPD